MRGAPCEGEPLVDEVGCGHYYRPRHLGFPFKPATMDTRRNYIGFAMFIGVLIAVVLIVFLLVEPVRGK